MHKIVHLDLKGAPPKVAYLEQVLLCIKSWGATGVLMEWEDTFPYTRDLVDIGSQGGSGGDGVYLQDEVKHIFNFAKQLGIQIIQLVQMFGHMEFVLKHPKYSQLREEPRSPTSLCPTREGAQALVREMLAQVMDAQPDAEYIHIGADEVWHIGKCPQCKAKAATLEAGAASLYLEHVVQVAQFVRARNPNVTVLMWDDMLRNIDLNVLKKYDLDKWVQPVIWDYNAPQYFRISPALWHKYGALFPQVWAASAYKGANGSCQIVSPVSRYVGNHEAWLREIRNNSDKVKFAGVILTGWSRYDHYATLCELLPVSLPSLASCLRLLTKPDNVPSASVVSEYLPSEEWPGKELARCIHSFVVCKEKAFKFIHGDSVTTWMNAWQIENNYTTPLQVEGIANTARELIANFTELEQKLYPSLNAVTGRRSADEWGKTYVSPLVTKLSDLLKVAEARSQADASVSPGNTLSLSNKYWNVQ